MAMWPPEPAHAGHEVEAWRRGVACPAGPPPPGPDQASPPVCVHPQEGPQPIRQRLTEGSQNNHTPNAQRSQKINRKHDSPEPHIASEDLNTAVQQPTQDKHPRQQ